MPAKKSVRRVRRARMSDDLSPMSLLQAPDEPKPEPMPGPQLSYGCSSCQHLPMASHRLIAYFGAFMVLMSGVLLSSTFVAEASAWQDLFDQVSSAASGLSSGT
ncbi:hypothetical protein A2856_03250 [Candidatus Uhrbacteria bacterium RIFCSPHIGHO2_01_FULL_63_20]|uniref:Uncharacterized protein n=1 Tax=Candidatus Uhrbacteria bacterium RIFCSPHIGHO2_01_FULL_63_20 TaxID=1802385 RepID=A0A1F7TL88_9BACT|nr:MAG: hypothetical protein A2856_03250 [Candidatus Uhrbacteria bacterium RIFCSPHIGHO2_01_FULL_63_20]